MNRRHRAVLLLEILTVLFMVAVGGTLMTAAITSILRSQKRVTDFGDRYTALNDFLEALRRDVRRVTTARLGAGDGGDLRQVLILGEPPERVAYRFYEQHVERREGPTGGSSETRGWEAVSASAEIQRSRTNSAAAIVSVTAYLRRSSADAPAPVRRFGLALRCVGEVVDGYD